MASPGPHRRPLAWLPFVLACLALFGLLAWQVASSGELTRLDLRVTLWLASHRDPLLTRALLLVSELHRTAGVLAMAALAAGWLLWRGLRRPAAALLLVPSGMLLNVGLKNLFQRIRPSLDEPLVSLTTYSFPSGHGVASTLLYGVLCALVLAHCQRRAARAAATGGAVAMVLVVCFSRVYLGAHYLSDVVAAVAWSLAWLVAGMALLRPGPARSAEVA